MRVGAREEKESGTKEETRERKEVVSDKLMTM